MPKLKPAEFEEIRELAKRRFGLDLRHGKEELVSARLSRAMRQGRFRSFRDYLSAVDSDRTGQELINLINSLTTNHTSFYREPHHFEFLTSEILPISGRPPTCGSGAPPVPPEKSPTRSRVPSLRPGRDRYEVCGCSPRISPPRCWTSPGPGSISHPRCNRRHPTGCPISSCAREMRRATSGFAASWRPAWSSRRLNLIEPFPFQERFHVIFCRNVMIYFDKTTQENLVHKLAARLEPGGYLLVGHSESLAGIRQPLAYLRPAIYRNAPGKQRQNQ